ncbi:cystatin-like isoform X2 [Rhinoraja longicauda]
MGMRAVLVTALAAALVAALAGRARACGKAMLNAGLGRESAPSPPLGTPTDISVDNANVVKAANFAIAKYNMKSNDVYLYRSQRLVSAKQQMVSGVMFYIEMYIGKTECRKTGTEKADSCAFVSPMEVPPLTLRKL